MNDKIQQNREAWKALLYKALPFSEAVSDELSLSRLLRLSLFQVSCGMAIGIVKRYAKSGHDRRAYTFLHG